MIKRCRAVLAAVAVAALLPSLAMVPASASRDPFEGDCVDRGKGYILFLYHKDEGGSSVPLRCGEHRPDGSGFGYRHIEKAHGFTGLTHIEIQDTLLHPDHIDADGTSRTYIQRFPLSNDSHRVTWQRQVWREDGLFKGIITEYHKAI